MHRDYVLEISVILVPCYKLGYSSSSEVSKLFKWWTCVNCFQEVVGHVPKAPKQNIGSGLVSVT